MCRVLKERQNWIGIIKEKVFQLFPLEEDEDKEDSWKICVTAIHSANRTVKNK